MRCFFHRRSNREPKPVYWVRAEQLVGEGDGADVDEIVITFAGERVPNVWRTKVVLSNDGNGELDSDAIAATDPLRLVLGPRTKVLGDPVVRSTQHVDFDWVSLDDDGIGLVFDFMNPGAAALVEVVHTGRPEPRIQGEIKGVPRGFRYKGALAGDPAGELREIRRWSVFLVTVQAVVLTLMSVGWPGESVVGGVVTFGVLGFIWVTALRKIVRMSIRAPALFELEYKGTI